MASGDRFLVHPRMGHDLLHPPGQPAADGLSLDAPGLVPRDPQEPGRALDRAIAQQVNGQPLERGRNLTGVQVPHRRGLGS
jgi:hypothetical protein